MTIPLNVSSKLKDLQSEYHRAAYAKDTHKADNKLVEIVKKIEKNNLYYSDYNKIFKNDRILMEKVHAAILVRKWHITKVESRGRDDINRKAIIKMSMILHDDLLDKLIENKTHLKAIKINRDNLTKFGDLLLKKIAHPSSPKPRNKPLKQTAIRPQRLKGH